MHKMQRKQQTMKGPTSIEKIGYNILSEIGVKFEPQASIAGKFTVDALVHESKLVIQFDGDYWHGHPLKFESLDQRQATRVAYDKSQDAYMKKCGFTVIRFWGSDLRESPEGVRGQLLQAIYGEPQ